MEEFTFKSIGVINTPHKDLAKTPIQPVFAKGTKGTVELDEEYKDGLLDLEGFSHIFLYYVFHKAEKTKLQVCPFLQDIPHGVFATRAPCRPNKIGFSVVKLLSIEGTTLHIEDADMLDSTPLLDIKPFVERFDIREKTRSGWQDDVDDITADRKGTRAE